MTTQRTGKLIILDGPSSVGKSTIALRLLREPSLRLKFVERYTSRNPRPGDIEEGNYKFVTTDQFEELEQQGAFVEVRHFQFGMSYGLSTNDINDTLTTGANALAIISLGNIDKVRRLYPDAIGVFITAPLDIVESRLRARGLDESMIQERLNNAANATKLAAAYDFVVVNDEGRLVESAKTLIEYLLRVVTYGRDHSMIRSIERDML